MQILNLSFEDLPQLYANSIDLQEDSAIFIEIQNKMFNLAPLAVKLEIQ
jgi:hypothetical protein